MRDAYGNRMLDDFSAQLWYHIVDANCDPRDPYDPLCVPVDQVQGYEKVGSVGYTKPIWVSKRVQKMDGRIEQKLACIVVLVRFCCIYQYIYIYCYTQIFRCVLSRSIEV